MTENKEKPDEKEETLTDDEKMSGSEGTYTLQSTVKHLF